MDPKGTILYIGGFELPDKNAAAHRVLANAKLFRLCGYNTIFVGVDKSGKCEVEKASGFEAHAVKYPDSLKSWIHHVTSAKEYLNIARVTPDLKMIVCYNFPAISLLKIKKYCKEHNIKCIADVTEWYSISGHNIMMCIAKGIDTCFRMRFIHKSVDGLIVISRYLESYYSNCNNVLYIPPLTDVDDIKWKKNESAPKERIHLTYAGSPGKKDRIDLLIGALKMLERPYHLDVVGINKEEYLAMYSHDKDFLTDNNNIVFYGRVSHQEALGMVKRATFSCFFRENNRVSSAGFPTKFAEAISAGTPVITNKTSNLNEYATGIINGYLLDDIDTQSIASFLEQVNITLPVQRETFDYRNYKKQMLHFLQIV